LCENVNLNSLLLLKLFITVIVVNGKSITNEIIGNNKHKMTAYTDIASKVENKVKKPFNI